MNKMFTDISVTSSVSSAGNITTSISLLGTTSLLFAGEPLLFAPGEGWSYSNAGFVVLGAVVEQVSKGGYFEYVREHIFAPVGIADTDSYELAQVVPNLAVGYARFDDDPLGSEPRRSDLAFLPWKGSPAGGGYSTAPDLSRCAQALRGYQLLGEETASRLIDFADAA